MKKYFLMSIFAIFTASLCAQEAKEVQSDTTKKERHIHPSMVDGPRRQPKYVVPLCASDTDVNEVYFFLNNQTIDPSRINLAKELMRKYTYTTDQIVKLGRTFETSDYRERFFEKAFKNCSNPEEYTKCLKELKEEVAVDKLKHFIEKKNVGEEK